MGSVVARVSKATKAPMDELLSSAEARQALWRHTRPWSASSGRADARMDESTPKR